MRGAGVHNGEYSMFFRGGSALQHIGGNRDVRNDEIYQGGDGGSRGSGNTYPGSSSRISSGIGMRPEPCPLPQARRGVHRGGCAVRIFSVRLCVAAQGRGPFRCIAGSCARPPDRRPRHNRRCSRTSGSGPPPGTAPDSACHGRSGHIADRITHRVLPCIAARLAKRVICSGRLLPGSAWRRIREDKPCPGIRSAAAHDGT